MAGYKSGTAWKSTMLKKFNGDEKALKAYLKEIGSHGGAKSRGGGFTNNPELARIAGSISRRNKKHDATN
jgi:general stress protein YciG